MSSQLQNKLLNYEVSPSPGVWNKIAEAIYYTSPALSKKLSSYEETPPTFVWGKISAALEKPATKATKVVPFFTRYKMPLKYSGTAAIFIVTAIVITLLASKQTKSELPIDNAANYSSGDTNKTDEIKRKKNQAIYNSKFNSASKKIISNETNEIVAGTSRSNKYVIAYDNDGNLVRLSKKIYNSFACSANNITCKERLKKLRKKFAFSAVTSDFAGVLQLLKSLQENQ